MSGRTVEERVVNLERLAETLAPLPGEVRDLTVRASAVEGRLATVESQIVQLRIDMDAGFSAVHGELSEMRGEQAGLRREVSDLREDVAALGRDTAAQFINLGNEMRTLFEESLGRRRVIAEGDTPPRDA